VTLVLWGGFSSCTVMPAATNFMIDDSMNSAQMGSSTGQILNQYGTPHYHVVIPRPRDVVEIWGYDMGNYWVNDAVFLIFRNDALTGISKHPYEMLQTLHSLRILSDGAVFSRLAEDEAAAQVSAGPQPQSTRGNSLREKMSAAAAQPSLS